LRDTGSRVSLFIGADPLQIEAASRTGAEVVELHTGAYCDAAREGSLEAETILKTLRAGARQAASLGLEVHAGHGIDYDTVAPIAAMQEVRELNIGHFLVGEAIFVGLAPAVAEMRRRMDAARISG
jgi:pyridoxine 5-phosphate synthase